MVVDDDLATQNVSDVGVVPYGLGRQFLSPDFQPKVERENREKREGRAKKIKADNPGMNEASVVVATIYQELNEQRMLNKIQGRVYGQILEILLSHLTEKSQREAAQKMRALSADEVFKDVD